MTGGYTLSNRAEGELDYILERIATRDGLERALHVHGKFVDGFEHLASMPRTGTTRPELTGERVRWWNIFKWIVLYDPETSPITILRIIHGGRELGRILRQDH